ncbi:MAG: hypothetical protein K6L60_05500 [Oceanobacter sp.]
MLLLLLQLQFIQHMPERWVFAPCIGSHRRASATGDSARVTGMRKHSV